ncbi:MAG: hypothetical protein OXG95_00270 [Chloroflexi bacterium]|nr:hypothetical protein [Chloroflexota bacterium]
MVTAGKHHNSTLCHIATEPLTRVIACWRRGERYDIRDCNRRPVSMAEGKRIIAERYRVPAEVRQQRWGPAAERASGRAAAVRSRRALRRRPVRLPRYGLSPGLDTR